MIDSIDNPILMNEWKIKPFMIMVLTIILLVPLLFFISFFGFEIVILKQILGAIYISFIPGIIILRILKIHNLGIIKTLIYSVCLSIVFNMIVGLFINIVFPLFEQENPLSPINFIVVYTLVLLILSIMAYVIDRDYSSQTSFNLSYLISPPVLFSIFLLLLAVLGTQLVNVFEDNTVLLILISLICIFTIIIMITRTYYINYYPIIIFFISLALIWHFTLISKYLVGYDVFSEYLYCNQVLTSGIWNSNVPNSNIYNAMISISILPSVIFNITGISGETIFKVIYPIYYALVPLGLFVLFKEHFNDRYAFYAIFVFIGTYVFYLEISSAERQIIGELFCVPVLLIATGQNSSIREKILLIVFLLGLVVSHYSITYLYIVFFILTILVLRLIKKRSIITSNLILLFIVISLGWYIFTSNSSIINSIIGIGQSIYQNFTIDFFNPFSRDISMYAFQSSPTLIHFIARIFTYIILFFTACGLLYLIYALRKGKLHMEYALFAICNYILLAASIIIPTFSNRLGAERVLNISFLVIAPFCIAGGIMCLNIVWKGLKRIITHLSNEFSYKVLSFILVIFFLLNSGFVFEVTHDLWVHSLPLSLPALENPERQIILKRKIALRYICPTEQEIASALWLSRYRDSELAIYADYWDIRVPSLTAYGSIPSENTIPLVPDLDSKKIKKGYIYLGYVNTKYGYGVTNPVHLTDPEYLSEPLIWTISEINGITNNKAIIYSNNGSSILWSSKN